MAELILAIREAIEKFVKQFQAFIDSLRGIGDKKDDDDTSAEA